VAFASVFALSTAMMFTTMAVSPQPEQSGGDSARNVVTSVVPPAEGFSVTYGTAGVYKDGFDAVCKPVIPATELHMSQRAEKAARRVANSNAISDLDLPENVRLNDSGLPTSYARRIHGTATAYTGGGTTASGRPAKLGYVAVDPREIPYGTELYIVSTDGKYVYGYCIAADTGGFVKGGWADVDLYMDTRSECLTFGIRGVEIYVL